jgi:LCP family protein required for cell wall assembly
VNSLGYTGKKFNGVYKNGYNTAIKAGKTKEEAREDGIKTVARMIKVTFGLPVNKYILADLDGFKAMVDAVGGVDMEVPVRMKYADPEQNLYIDLEQGWQHLDGGKAEQLIRFRGYAMADIERIRTQQKFMAALMKKMLKFDVGQIKKLFDINSKYVTTNLTTIETGWFAAKMLDVKLENIRMNTIPGEEYWVGADSCYSTYKAEVMEIINKYYNPYTEEIPANNFNIFEPSRQYAHLSNIDGITMDSLVK